MQMSGCFMPWLLYPPGRAPSTHLIGGLGGPQRKSECAHKERSGWRMVESQESKLPFLRGYLFRATQHPVPVRLSYTSFFSPPVTSMSRLHPSSISLHVHLPLPLPAPIYVNLPGPHTSPWRQKATRSSDVCNLLPHYIVSWPRRQQLE